jgi:hypothetical protein
MGASNGRAENPQSVTRAIEQTLRVRVDGHEFAGVGEVQSLIRAIRVPSRYYVAERPAIEEIHKAIPGRERLLQRYYAIRDAIPRLWASAGWSSIPDPSLARQVPNSMTASNLAVATINQLAHHLHHVGVPGLVIIFDEAERSEWAGSWYREERARNLMMGFALASANKDTSDLKHYRNEESRPYRPVSPSLLHSIFAFTWEWGLAQSIATGASCPVLRLEPLADAVRHEIETQLRDLYTSAYGNGFSLAPEDLKAISLFSSGEDIRTFVRCVVAALDHRRLLKEFPIHAG